VLLASKVQLTNPLELLTLLQQLSLQWSRQARWPKLYQGYRSQRIWLQFPLKLSENSQSLDWKCWVCTSEKKNRFKSVGKRKKGGGGWEDRERICRTMV